MHILLLTWDYPPANGGIQVWMFQLARRLPDAELEVIAPAAAGAHSFDRANGVRVRRLSGQRLGPSLWLLRMLPVLLIRCVRRRPDLIVCGHVVTGLAGLVVRRLLGIPYVVFAYAYEVRRKRQRRLLTAVLTGASAIIAISSFTREFLVKLGAPAESIFLLHPGVDTERFTPASEEQSPQGPRTLLTVSRLHDLYKGVDTVIRALPLIRAKCPAVRYVVVGGGRLRGYLERLAESVSVSDAVVFLGEVPDKRLPELYRSADVVVQLSREEVSSGGAEGFGIVCLEGGAAGKPVVAGRSGGLVDAVQDGATGILVSPNDLGTVAHTIAALILDRERADRLGRKGRERACAEFTWDAMARRARGVFAEAAARYERQLPIT